MTVPFSVHDHVVHFSPAGRITSASKTPQFFAERDRPELTAGFVLTVYEYDRTWEYRELHPDGDELAIALGGTAAVLLGSPGAEARIDLPPDQGVVIPSNTWHRVAAHEPSTILFVTPTPATTDHQTIPR